MWCLQMLLANSYILYKKYTKMHDLEAISHFYLTSRYVWLGLILITIGQKRNTHIKLGIAQFNPQLAVHSPLLI